MDNYGKRFIVTTEESVNGVIEKGAIVVFTDVNRESPRPYCVRVENFNFETNEVIDYCKRYVLKYFGEGDKRNEMELCTTNGLKVGDIVTAITNRYCITNTESTCKVTEVNSGYSDYIEVEVISHKTMPIKVGSKYAVKSSNFVLTTKNGFKVGDVITGKHNNGYIFTSEEATMEVIKIGDSSLEKDIKVRIIRHKTADSEVGEEYSVDSDRFILANSKEESTVSTKEEVFTVKYNKDTKTATVETEGETIAYTPKGETLESVVRESVGKVFEAGVEAEEIEEELKYFNGKLVCVESSCRWFTVGKIYEYVDGVTTDDDGDLNPDSDPILADLSNISKIYRSVKFIKIVE